MRQVAMLMPAMAGVLKRRLLVNFRADPEVVRLQLPEPFEPKLHRGYAVVGICLIRLEHLRPVGFPPLFGLSSENAAHRFAVTWIDSVGRNREGVYVSRRDSNSWITHRTGGRLFPGIHHRADFVVSDDGVHVDLAMVARDGDLRVEVVGDEAEFLPRSSLFESVVEASKFFERGSCGYSPALAAGRLEGMELRVRDWRAGAFAATTAFSSLFEDESLFPPGSIEFDHALVMRDIQHEWQKLGAPAGAEEVEILQVEVGATA
jgi:hypothetical protein